MQLRDPVGAVIVFLFAAGVFYIAGNYPPDAALFPRAVAAIMMVSAVALGFRQLVSNASWPVETIDRRSMMRISAVILATLLYIVAVDRLGYATASLIFIPLTAWALGVRRPGLIAVTTLIFVGLLTLLFRQVFSIPLPREVVLGLFG